MRHHVVQRVQLRPSVGRSVQRLHSRRNPVLAVHATFASASSIGTPSPAAVPTAAFASAYAAATASSAADAVCTAAVATAYATAYATANTAKCASDRASRLYDRLWQRCRRGLHGVARPGLQVRHHMVQRVQL